MMGPEGWVMEVLIRAAMRLIPGSSDPTGP